MSIKISDRVKETSATTGVGTLTLAGAFSSAFDTFSHGIGNGQQTFYVIENAAGWETGIGTYSSAGNTLSRDLILSSSAGGSAVSLVGTSTVFCGQSAVKSVFVDVSGNLDLTRVSGVVFSDGSLQTVAGGNPTSISGWADSTMSARDVLVSGWALANDITMSGWVASNATANSGWGLAADLGISGWAKLADAKILSQGTTLIMGVSGWADLAMSARDAALSGWANSTFAPTAISGWAGSTISNTGAAVSGWANSRDAVISGWALTTLVNSGISLSGWASSTISNGDAAVSGWANDRDIVVSGWSDSTMTARDTALSGWAKSTIDASGQDVRVFAIVTATGALTSAIQNDWYTSGQVVGRLDASGAALIAADTALSGWAQATFDGIPSLTAISGWTSSTIVNSGNALKTSIDASGNAVSGWAQSTFNAIVSSTIVSGWADRTITNSGATLSGWAQSTFDGIPNATAISGWAASTIINSGQAITTAYTAADTAVSGWANTVFGLVPKLTGINSFTNDIDISGGILRLLGGTTTRPVIQIADSGVADDIGIYYVAGNVEPLQIRFNGTTMFGIRSNGILQVDTNQIYMPAGAASILFNNSTLARNTSNGRIDFSLGAVSGIDYTTIIGNSGSKTVVRGAGNQQAPLQEWQNSSSGVVASMKNDGSLYASGGILFTDGSTITSNTLSTSAVSGWANSTIINSGQAVSGWAQNTFTGLPSATQTLTNKRVTPRASGMSDAGGSPFINTDNCDIFIASGQKVNISSFTTNLTGTPTNGQLLWIAVAGTSGAIAITWGASFESSTLTLPTTTVSTTRLDMGFVWNSMTSKWRLVAQA